MNNDMSDDQLLKLLKEKFTGDDEIREGLHLNDYQDEWLGVVDSMGWNAKVSEVLVEIEVTGGWNEEMLEQG